MTYFLAKTHTTLATKYCKVLFYDKYCRVLSPEKLTPYPKQFESIKRERRGLREWLLYNLYTTKMFRFCKTGNISYLSEFRGLKYQDLLQF